MTLSNRPDRCQKEFKIQNSRFKIIGNFESGILNLLLQFIDCMLGQGRHQRVSFIVWMQPVHRIAFL